ncbi:MAG: histone deacetylase [Armatimonadota bacterium]|jgi:acetoin utilization deacetylase AcuC-like enzyme
MRYIVYSAQYHVDMGEHVFPVRKYRLCYEALRREGAIEPGEVLEPIAATEPQLLLVHTPEYLTELETLAATGWSYLTPDTPITAEILEKSILAAGGTIAAARLALETQIAVHLSGGFHHAFPDHGEGFCYINDVAVAVRVLQDEGAIERAAVIDCDVHQGNGTAAIFAASPEVFTFSIHQENNYPFPKPPSDLDIGLPDGADDAAYLGELERHVPTVLERSRPDLVVYLAGADPYADDLLGGLGLSMEGLKQRDALVMEACAARGTPVVVLLAGGYAARTEDTIRIHCNTVKAARGLLPRAPTATPNCP